MMRLISTAVALCLACASAMAEVPAEKDRVELLGLLAADLGIKTVDPSMQRDLGRWLPELMASHALQFSGDPDRMDRIASFIDERRIILPDGDMAATAYHAALNRMRGFEPRMFSVMLEDWRSRAPQSAMAHLAVAESKLDAAAGQWRMAFVTANVTQGFTPDSAALREAHRALLASKPVAAKDPYWYHVMAEVLVFRRASEEQIKALVEEGLRAFPENVQLAVAASNYYLPKWQGEAEQLPAYARWVMSLPAAAGRADIYPRIYANALDKQYNLLLFKLVDKDWSLMRRGLKALLGNYPTTANRNMVALLACLGGDRRLTHDVMMHGTFATLPGAWPHRDAPGICWDWALTQ